jgi:hypothetical protein
MIDDEAMRLYVRARGNTFDSYTALEIPEVTVVLRREAGYGRKPSARSSMSFAT